MATAFKIAAEDNVATMLESSRPQEIQLRGEALQEEFLNLIESIELGHKIALQAIAPGEKIIKYGVAIGLASQPIQRGEWVHLHNCQSQLDERSSTLDLHTGLPGDTRYE
jgi:hypothetical protein